MIATMNKVKLITCFLEKDQAPKLVEHLHNEFGINTAHFAHARGQCSSNHNIHLWKERDIIHIVVNDHQADEIFEEIYFFQEMDQRPNGFIFQEELMLSSQFMIPEPPTEAVKEAID